MDLTLYTLRCILFGCKTKHEDGCDFDCVRCGATYYEFIYSGYCSKYVHWWQNLARKIRGRKCEVCGKRYHSKKLDVYWCSKECYDKWIPF